MQFAGKVKWFLRLVALTGATVCGIWLVAFVCLLPRNYNWETRRFLPFIKQDIPTAIAVALGFLCLLMVYGYLVRNMRQNSR